MAVYKQGNYIHISLNNSQTICLKTIAEQQPFVVGFDCFKILTVFVKHRQVKCEGILLLKTVTVVNKPFRGNLLMTRSRKEASQSSSRSLKQWSAVFIPEDKKHTDSGSLQPL